MSVLSPRRPPRPALVLDLLIGVALTVYLTAATSLQGFQVSGDFRGDVIEGVAVALRRVWTIPAFVAVAVVALFNDLTTWPYPLGLAIMIFTVAAGDFPRWAAWAATVVGMAVLLAPWPDEVELTPNVLIYLVPEVLLFTLAPALVGFYSKTRRHLLDALSQRAADAERHRRLEGERVRADERNRLANEIHDVVAHRVSLMVVHTGALKLAATDPRTREVADLVRSSGRMALEELRELVGVLRSDETAPLAPTPRLANLPALVQESRGTGSTIEFVVSGTPRRLASVVERTGYRVVQESLTNARKHAPGAPVRVELVWGISTLELDVCNGPPEQPIDSFPSGGHGLQSLRERVGIVSGEFRSGPARDGGWRVHASLPMGDDT